MKLFFFKKKRTDLYLIKKHIQERFKNNNLKKVKKQPDTSLILAKLKQVKQSIK